MSRTSSALPLLALLLTTAGLSACSSDDEGGATGGSDSGGAAAASGTWAGGSGSGSGGGQGGDGPSEPPTGEELYELPHADGNTFACSTCHALEEPAPDGFTRPGHPIGDSFGRASFKNGELTELRDAVNVCRTEWLATTAWDGDDPNWLALEGFLEEQAAGTTPEEVTIQVVAAPADAMGGDHVAGQDTFNNRCVVCHAEDAVGSERAPSIAGTMLGADFIANKIRTSGTSDSIVYDGLTGGRMPFWGGDRLSDDQLRDIIAFLAMTEPNETPVGTSDAVDISLSDGQMNCGAAHPSVGKSATLSTNAHSVSGTVTVVDDCTLEFDMFNFDGGGIEVRMYGGTAGTFTKTSPVLSDDFKGTAFTDGKAIVRLPGSISLDDFDSVSVWCVAAGFSFGDATF